MPDSPPSYRVAGFPVLRRFWAGALPSRSAAGRRRHHGSASAAAASAGGGVRASTRNRGHLLSPSAARVGVHGVIPLAFKRLRRPGPVRLDYARGVAPSLSTHAERDAAGHELVTDFYAEISVRQSPFVLNARVAFHTPFSASTGKAFTRRSTWYCRPMLQPTRRQALLRHRCSCLCPSVL